MFLVHGTHQNSHKNTGRGEASYTADTVYLTKVNSVQSELIDSTHLFVNTLTVQVIFHLHCSCEQ